MRDVHDSIRHYVRFFEELKPADLENLDKVFAPEAIFRDPFNDVQGIEAIKRVFAHMFQVCRYARFSVTEYAAIDGVAYLHWIFHYCSRRSRQHREIEGVSRVAFRSDGLVLSHTDYWDPARAIYEVLPIIGGIVRWVRRMLSAGGPEPPTGCSRY